MNIWLINHYAVPPQYYPLARQTNFAKHLMAMGHSVTIISASTVHNSDLNLITDKTRWREETADGVRHVYIKCRGYQGNGASRIMNMCEFARKLPGVCKNLERPDAIVATSMPPMSCAVGIKLAKKYGCKGIAEIADLWPESIVAYGIAGPHNPAVIALRRLEKWIYMKADAVIFTMEGAYDYIIGQGWEKDVPRDKVFFINNGVDLKAFDYNKEHYQFSDPDLDDPETFKVVYTGSLRHANSQIWALMNAIALIQEKNNNKDMQFLIYGKGELVPQLEQYCSEHKLTNVKLKGFAEKKYIPYILSKCDLNVLNCAPNKILKYGGSQNKLFDYLASGKPVLSGENPKYSVIAKHGCGISRELKTPEDVVKAIEDIRNMNIPYEHIRETAKMYDFSELTNRLMEVIEKA